MNKPSINRAATIRCHPRVRPKGQRGSPQRDRLRRLSMRACARVALIWRHCAGGGDSCRKQDHLVGHRAGVGKILVDRKRTLAKPKFTA